MGEVQTGGQVDLFDPGFIRDPYGMYRTLRKQSPVVCTVTPNGMKVWVVTKYEDVRAGLADPRLSKDMVKAAAVLGGGGAEGQALAALPPSIARNLLGMDAPEHTRLRKVVSQAFTARRVQAMRPRIAEIADSLLDAVAGREEIDLVADIGRPMPMLMMGELLGLPPADADKLRSWTEILMSMSTRPVEEFLGAAQDMHDYLAKMIVTKRAEPTDDLLSALVTGGVAEQLTENELISLASLLIIAGFETTSNLIGNAMLGLFAHPDQLDLLRRDPGLLPAAVDELVRFDGPAHMATFRFTAEPVEFSGTTIPAGEVVMLSLLAANRDEEQFTDPDRVDLHRSQAHLGFGRGMHFCIGAALARAEGEIMLGKLLSRFPAIRLAVPADQIAWQFTLLTRGAEHLQVLLT